MKHTGRELYLRAFSESGMIPEGNEARVSEISRTQLQTSLELPISTGELF